MIDIGRCYGNCRAHEKQTFRGFTVSTRFCAPNWDPNIILSKFYDVAMSVNFVKTSSINSSINVFRNNAAVMSLNMVRFG